MLTKHHVLIHVTSAQARGSEDEQTRRLPCSQELALGHQAVGQPRGGSARVWFPN